MNVRGIPENPIGTRTLRSGVSLDTRGSVPSFPCQLVTLGLVPTLKSLNLLQEFGFVGHDR